MRKLLIQFKAMGLVTFSALILMLTVCCLHIKEFGAVPPSTSTLHFSHTDATRLPPAQDSPFSLFTCMHKLIRALFAWLLLLCLVLFPRAAAHVQLQTLTLLENVNKSC